MNDPVVGKANMDQNSFMSHGHIGTHLDSYLQTKVPPEFHLRRGVVLDGSPWVEKDEEIETSILDGRDIQEGDFVIFYTGAINEYGYGTKDYFKDHPQLGWDLINTLLEKKVSIIGLDAAGVRRGDEHGVADRLAEDQGAYIVENINNVDELLRLAGDREFKVFTGWTGFRGHSGLQCRVIADLLDTVANAN
jgi:kynurenine formamidase